MEALTLPLGIEGFATVGVDGGVALYWRHLFGADAADASHLASDASLSNPSVFSPEVTGWSSLRGVLCDAKSVCCAALCAVGDATHRRATTGARLLIATVASPSATDVVIEALSLPPSAAAFGTEQRLVSTPMGRLTVRARVTHLAMLPPMPSACCELLVLTTTMRHQADGAGFGQGGQADDDDDRRRGSDGGESRSTWHAGVQLWARGGEDRTDAPEHDRCRCP